MPLPLDNTVTEAERARNIVNELATIGNDAIRLMANSCAMGLAHVWMANDAEPAAVLAAMKTNGVRFFDEHRRAITYLWSDADTRAVFLAACVEHGVVCNVVNGLPEFPCVLETTTHNDGTVTVNG